MSDARWRVHMISSQDGNTQFLESLRRCNRRRIIPALSPSGKADRLEI